MELVLDTVQAGHHQGCEGQVGIGGRIGEANFDAASLGALHIRYANRGGTVAGGIGQHDRGFEAGYQTFVAVGGCVTEGIQGLGVLDDAADVVQGSFRQAAILITGKQVFTIFGQ